MDAPAPSAAAPARLAHLRRYARLSHLRAHTSTTSSDPAIRVPRPGALQDAYDKLVAEETALLLEKIRAERERIAKLSPPPPPQSKLEQTSPKKSQLNTLLTLQHLHATLLASSLPPPYNLYVPPSTSPLCPVLLHQHLLNSLAETVTTLHPSLRQSISRLRTTLSHESTSQAQTSLLTTSLRNRLSQLESTAVTDGSHPQETEDEILANNILNQLMTSLSLYSQAQRKFLRELSKFVTVHLARMIAAEDVGGPVVGEDVTVTLPLGSARSAKAPPREREPGQRTISSMLNPSKKRGADTDGDSEEPTTEKQPQLAPTPQETLAAKSLKSLLEDLMNAAMRPGEYVTLPEPGDSAAARFLVRANVAVLHPRDARRLRLVEFGKSIED